MTRTFNSAEEVARDWRNDPVFRAVYQALEGEFEQAKTLVRARIAAQASRVAPVDEAEALDWIERLGVRRTAVTPPALPLSRAEAGHRPCYDC